VRRKALLVIAVLGGVVTAALIGGSAGPASGDPTARAEERPVPQALTAVKPQHFRGDLRGLPAVRPAKQEQHLEPQEPENVPGPSAGDPLLQTEATSTPAPAASSFAGLDFAHWGAGWPPDTNGDVGPTYYVQTVNTSIGIFRKSDGVRVAAFTFNTLFGQSPTGTPCDNLNQGDPVVVYDPIGDRWVISDFAWSNYTSGLMYECMAVSATGDPVSGGWHFYAWQVENGGVLPDYPKLGVWPDGIYMSANNFSTTSGGFQNVQVWAFNRQELEAGGTAHAVTFNLPKTSGGVTVFSLLPSNARVATGLPPAGRPNYFASIWGSFAIRVWKFHVDYGTPANSTLTGPTNTSIASFNVGPSRAPELGGNPLDSLSYRLMMQNQYTNLNGTESLWLTHTVGSGGSPNVAQTRWYQLSVTSNTIASSPAQQSTWSPDSKNRFMPSLAVDQNGDMALGYSVSDATMYPAIRYAGRLAGDPSNTLLQGETSLIEGTGFQCCTFSDGSTNNRWGDYSAMTLDPDGCTFWYTSEYYANQPTTLGQDNWQTRIGSFSFPSCGGTTVSAPTITSFSPASGAAGASVTITGTAFTGATAVSFNGASATFTVTSATQISATVPPAATTGPISVTTPGGTAASAGTFTVLVAPTITSFSPSSGNVGTSVTITGAAFTGATSVTFNGTSATFTVNSATQISATVPPAATTGPISVTTAGGTATSGASFTITVPAPTAPTITSFSPTSGNVGASVTIAGTSFSGATSVTFNGTSATFTVNSATQISATVPPAATTGPISVTTAGGTATSGTSFTVTVPAPAAPTITSFSPTSARIGSSITISGTRFTGATSVKFNGVSASFTVASSTKIKAIVPVGTTAGPITVTTPGGTATSSRSFTVKR
jgi:IPT/TIG domain